jgi:hypothetical protein
VRRPDRIERRFIIGLDLGEPVRTAPSQDDLVTLRAMFQRANIPFTETGDAGSGVALTVERGYSGFVTVFDFFVDGSLRDVTAWE